MTEHTLRTRLKRSGWSRTDYPAINMLIVAGRSQDPVIHPIVRTSTGIQDHSAMLERALRALGLGYRSGYSTRMIESYFVELDERALKLLNTKTT
ncbi:MAG TPA: hypothetical protein PKJ19_13565 [Flavobacteriales bacterium]|nr:hypothetical protein [Flavobacteriales bacterium]